MDCTDLAKTMRRLHLKGQCSDAELKRVLEAVVVPLAMSRIRNSLSYSITELVEYDKLVRVTGIGERNLGSANGMAFPSTTFTPSYTPLPMRLPYVKYIESELQGECLRQKIEQYGQYAADQLDTRALNIFMRRAVLVPCTEIVGATFHLAREKRMASPVVISPYDGAPQRGHAPVNVGGRWYSASAVAECPVIAERLSDDMLMSRYAYAYNDGEPPIMGAPLMLKVTDVSWADDALSFTLGFSCPRVYRVERMVCLREA